MGLDVLSDLLLALLLVATITYAVILNKKLSALRATKDEMARLLGEFAKTTAQAEAGVKELRDRAAASGDGLNAVVAEATAKLEKAHSLNEDLAFLIEKGESLADRLERGIEGARAAQTRSKAAMPAKAAKKDEPAADDTLMRSLAGVR